MQEAKRAHQRKIFNLRTLVVKFISCFLAVGSGLPSSGTAAIRVLR